MRTNLALLLKRSAYLVRFLKQKRLSIQHLHLFLQRNKCNILIILMKKTITSFLFLTLALLLPASGGAQQARKLVKPGAMLPGAQLARLVPQQKLIARKNANNTMKAFDATVALWGNARINEQWGYYAFRPVNVGGKIDFTAMGKQGQRIARNGVQVADGKLYTVDFQRYGEGSGDLTLYTYDLTTWTGSGQSYNDFSLAAIETAQAADGTVYGEFFNSRASNRQYELGTVDYRTQQRTTFGTTSRRYVAMGITAAKQLYGIAADGNLYRISITDGKETLVGPTGLELTDEDGGPYDQTGEINPKDDTFFWYAQDKNYDTGLYTVNLQTGAATKIADTDFTMYGMLIAPATAADDVPAVATALAATFSGTSLSGSMQFTMPTQTAGGKSLTGSLNYTIKGNGAQLASGTALPGATVTTPITAPFSGNFVLAVTVTNAAGESAAATLNKWIGFDEPEKVGNPTATMAGGIVTIAWNAPTAGTKQGTLGPLTYDVVRIQGRDTTMVASGISATSCTDDVSAAQLASYTYAVRANSANVKGAWANTPIIIAGAAIEPDWQYTIEGTSALSLFKVIDANNDNFTWWSNGVTGYGAMSNQARVKAASDDWLLTPPIHISGDRVYTITFKVRNIMDAYRNTLEVKWGNGDTPAHMTNTLLNTFTPEYSETNGQWQVCTVDLIPTASGNVYIGFHDNTPAGEKFQIAIDKLTIKKTAYTASPDSVKSLTVTPAQRGALQATVQFVTPGLTLNGATLSRVDSFVVMRDDVWAGRISGSMPRAQVTWTDANVPNNGFHTYTITPYLNGHPGRATSTQAYIGMDRPKNPTGITFVDKGTTLQASWNAFSRPGANGGFLEPDKVSVTFFSLVNGQFGHELGDSLTTSQAGATSTTLAVDPNITPADDGKTQALAWFAARANSEGGHSDYVSARGVVVGPNIKLPFKESLTGGKLDNGFATLLGNAQYDNRKTAAPWRVVTDAASDNDGGSLVWANYDEEYAGQTISYTIQQGDETSVNLPKVTLSGAVRPKLFFDLYSLVGNEAVLKVLAQTPDGVDHLVAQYDLTQTSKNGWERKLVDLSAYTAERYIIVKFDGLAQGNKVLIGVDNINIIDQMDRNLAATSIKAPDFINAGKSDSVTVTLKNLGTKPADAYRVILFANDKPCDTVSINRPLASLANDTVRLHLPVAINEQADRLRVKATIEYDGDQLAADNTTEMVEVGVVKSPYGRISDLQATAADGGQATLTWGNPVLPEPERVTEGFEDFKPFAKQMAPWTLFDGDKGTAGALQQSSTYPGQGEAFAFIAFNPNWWIEDMTTINPGLEPHNGAQFAAAVYAYNADRKLVQQDNWLISPRLSGRKQEISFYVMNIATSRGETRFAEHFDVLYSTENTDTTTFVKLQSAKADGTEPFNQTANWKLITIELPEGAKHFAIHHNTPKGNAYAFGIDDITYEQLATGADDDVTAFIIYRDGKEIARVSGDKMTFTDTDAVGTHVYNVTAVYTSKQGEVNESGFSNDASITVSSLSTIEAGETQLDVTNLGGVRVKSKAKSLNGLPGGVYIINGKKRIVK